MKRGRKAETAAEHVRRGTLQPSRHGPAPDFKSMASVAVSSDMPQMPPELSPAARLVWTDNIARVVQTGMVAEYDETMFAQYCELVASCNACWAAKSVPPAAYLSEMRKYAEMFGVMGAKSRVKGKSDGGKGAGNPFANNGRRQ